MSGAPPWTLLPGEYLDQTTNTVWIELTRTEPCDEPGCYHAAFYELDRTVVPGTTAKLAFRCTTHAPKFIVGTGQQFATIGVSLPAIYTEDWENGHSTSMALAGAICEHAACVTVPNWFLTFHSLSSKGPSYLCSAHMMERMNSSDGAPGISKGATCIRLVWTTFQLLNNVVQAQFGSGSNPPTAGSTLWPIEKMPPLGKVKVLDSGCPDCWGTGFFKGHGINCQRGCKPGKPVLPPATGGRIFLI